MNPETVGTFGLSKGFITTKGMAGRIDSIITELFLPPSKRKYNKQIVVTVQRDAVA